MEKISIRFEPDPGLNHIEVLIRAPELDPDVSALMEQLSYQQSDMITVLDDRGVAHVIPEKDIVLISVKGKLVNVVTKDGSWFARRTLQSLEDELNAKRFVRISRYELVNLDQVLRYDFTVAGTLRLELHGGMETWAARRCIPELRRRLSGKE